MLQFGTPPPQFANWGTSPTRGGFGAVRMPAKLKFEMPTKDKFRVIIYYFSQNR